MHGVAKQALEWVRVSEERVTAAEARADRVGAELKKRAMGTLRDVATVEADVSEDELKAYIKANLAGYKAPREIEFLDELPRNATGKILKRDLHAREKQTSS